MAVDTPTRLLSATEVADRLNVAPSTVYRWIASGQLPAVAIGPRTVRVDPDELADYIYAEAES